MNELAPEIQKARDWDDLDAKIAKAYPELDEDSDKEEGEGYDLAVIGEWAASAFGYL